jgi:uncharacterized protein YkwD
MFDASKASTKNCSQFGQDINVKVLVDDTMANPTSAYPDINSRITKYSNSYDLNTSTPDTPTVNVRHVLSKCSATITLRVKTAQSTT